MNPFTSILLAALFVTTVSFAQKKERGSMQEIKVIFTQNTQNTSSKDTKLSLQNSNTLTKPFLKSKPSNKLTAQLKKTANLSGKLTEMHTLTANENYNLFVFGNDKTVTDKLKVMGDYSGDHVKQNKPTNTKPVQNIFFTPTKFADAGDTMNDYLKPSRFANGSDTSSDYLKPAKFTDAGDTSSDYLKPAKLSDSGDTMSDYLTLTEQMAVLFMPKKLKASGIETIQAQLIESGPDFEVWQWLGANLKPQPEHILIFTIK